MAGTAVSVAVAAPTLTAMSCLEPAPTVTAVTVEAPAISAATEPPGSDTTVRMRSIGSKAASIAAPAVIEPDRGTQTSALVQRAHANPSESVQPAKRWPAYGTARTWTVRPTLTESAMEVPGKTIS